MNSNQDQSPNQDRFKKRLHAEAIAERPSYSPAIHHRVMRAIHQPAPVALSTHRMTSPIFGAAAAAMLILAGFGAWRWSSRSPRASEPGRSMVASSTPLPSARQSERVVP